MKIIKIKVKSDLRFSHELAEEVFYKGRKLTYVSIEDRKGKIFHVFNVLYKNRIYFLVKADSVIAECYPLDCVPLPMKVNDFLNDELYEHCFKRCVEEL